MRAKCAALFMGAFFTHPLCAQTGLPIAFAVEENNRLFLNGDGLDFENDLHTYLHCVNPVKARSPECAEYVKQGTMHGELVPNLRRGPPFEEYATRYDKPRMQYRDEYVQNRMRRLTFTPREDAAAAAAKPGSKCSWTLQSVDGSSVAPVKQDCKAAVFDVELGQAATDAPLSFTGQVELAVVVPGAGSPEKFGIPVYSRDYLLVAFGDSFTSGEGNPEKNINREKSVVPAQWLDYRCHRTVFSYPVILSHMLSLADPRHSVTLLHYACSGARTSIGLMGPYLGALTPGQMKQLWAGTSQEIPSAWRTYGASEKPLPAQIDQASSLLKNGGTPAQRPDLVMLSIGVNDMGMVPLLTAIAEDEYDAEELAEDLKRSEGECVVEEREPNGESAVALDNRRRLAMSFGCLERRLKAVRKRMDEALAPRRTYMLEYLNPLLDEAGRPCGSEDEHDQLLDQMLDEVSAWEHVLGWLTGATDLNEHELEFARTQFYEPLIATTKKAANENGWKFISASRDEHRRGFCSRISWYHKFAASRERQGMIPGERLVSTGTLHPNTYGQYYAAMRALIATSFDQAFADHNVFCIRSAKMAAAEKGKPNPDGTYGFAWYIWNKDKANEKGRLAANYHAFLVDSTCKASRFKPNLQP